MMTFITKLKIVHNPESCNSSHKSQHNQPLTSNPQHVHYSTINTHGHTLQILHIHTPIALHKKTNTWVPTRNVGVFYFAPVFYFLRIPPCNIDEFFSNLFYPPWLMLGHYLAFFLFFVVVIIIINSTIKINMQGVEVRTLTST
jgi:hypothetical protein